MYTLRIKKAKLQPNKFWKNDILVSMVELKKDWKYVKFAKLTQELIDKIIDKDILVDLPKENEQLPNDTRWDRLLTP